MSDALKQAPRSGRTRTSIDKSSAPRLPHEHDESSDSQASGARQVIRQAQEDVASGKVDTDRGVPMDQAYQRQKDSAATDGKRKGRPS